MTDLQQQQKYIITDHDIKVIRYGCIHFENVDPCPDNCPYYENVEGGCLFDPAEYLSSRPHTPAAPATEYTIEQIAEIDNRIRKERKAERKQVLQLIHKKTFAMRHRASSEEVNNDAVILDYSAVYELLQSLRGGAP